MKLENKTILVTGSNRGIGKSLVEALLAYPVKKIYASARDKEKLPNFNDNRVVPVQLDITDNASIKKAAQLCSDLNVLINNAGVLSNAGILSNDINLLKNDMNTNYFGTLEMVRVFAEIIEKNGAGAIANIISILGLASMAHIGGYSASKAALFSATQAMRAILKAKNIDVYAIFPGPIDTDMNRGKDMPKASPESTAENILQGIIADTEDIFPDQYSKEAGQLWSTNPKALELEISSL